MPARLAETGQQRWGRDDSASCLWVGVDWERPPASERLALRPIYGDLRGGFLLGTPAALKVALLSHEPSFGLYTIDELGQHPEVRKAMRIAPSVEFFMDASNVQFYGHQDGRLFVFDTTDETLDDLGELEAGIEAVLAEWEAAGQRGSP